MNNLTKEQIDEIKKYYRGPFKYDPMSCYILSESIGICLDVRGYGALAGEENGEQIQDNFGQLVADLLNKEFGGEG